MVCEKCLNTFGDFLSHHRAYNGKALLGDRALSHVCPNVSALLWRLLITDSTADVTCRHPWPALWGCAVPLLQMYFLG